MPFVIDSINAETISQGGNPIKPYKVYTALLTQSGGDSPLNTSTGLLTIGVTYFINDTVIDMDFTNVGAPNNNVGTYFVATGTNPNWGTNPLGFAILNYNEGAPVVTVLENTIGNVWFEYVSTGNYSVRSSDLFLDNKTTLSINLMGDDLGTGFLCLSYIQNTEELGIVTGTEIGGSQDTILVWKTPIEIRVYN